MASLSTTPLEFPWSLLRPSYKVWHKTATSASTGSRDAFELAWGLSSSKNQDTSPSGVAALGRSLGAKLGPPRRKTSISSRRDLHPFGVAAVVKGARRQRDGLSLKSGRKGRGGRGGGGGGRASGGDVVLTSCDLKAEVSGLCNAGLDVVHREVAQDVVGQLSPQLRVKRQGERDRPRDPRAEPG